MNSRIISVVTLFTLLSVSLCSAQPTNDGVLRSASATGKIKLKGKISPSCHIKLNNSQTLDLIFTNNETESRPIALTSYCNHESQHKIKVSYDGLLKYNTNTIPYSVVMDGMELPAGTAAGHTVSSNGLSYEGNVKLKFAPNEAAPAGDYKGKVVFTITHGV
ncbi:MAG: hypothetical protein J0G29_02585 [Alphaproteobacteria bacterium]|nr:hypothetical protein [Alphaproteobacteria bacterium]OJV47173.1 MAG: hypothetical protein BGO28_01905 [Alphaproteobacteria bacterium 43-37]